VFVVSYASKPNQFTLEEETAFPIGEQDNLEKVVKTKIGLRWQWSSEFPLVQADWYSGSTIYRKEIKMLLFIFFNSSRFFIIQSVQLDLEPTSLLLKG
jgi:hypothetical protein